MINTIYNAPIILYNIIQTGKTTDQLYTDKYTDEEVMKIFNKHVLSNKLKKRAGRIWLKAVDSNYRWYTVKEVEF